MKIQQSKQKREIKKIKTQIKYHMKNLTPYAKGRADVINEITNYCNKKLDKIQKHPPTDVVAVKSLRVGLNRAYNDIIKRLEVKSQRMAKKKTK